MMAITPKTVINNPATLAVGLVACLGVGIVTASELNARDNCASKCPYTSHKSGETSGVEELDVRDYLDAQKTTPPDEFRRQLESQDANPPTYESGDSRVACRAGEETAHWSERRWVAYLDCLDRRGEHHQILLEETTRGLSHLNRSSELAVQKGRLLAIHGTTEETLDFLEHALDHHDTPGDARLDELYVRELVWRGGRLDVNRAFQTLRKRGLSTQAQIASTCRGKQALAWMNYGLINRSESHSDDVKDWDYRADKALIDDYVVSNCDHRVHTGEWSVLAEVVGAGVLAEQLNGHDGDSTMIRKAVESFEIRNVRALCRDAVPAQTDLWEECEARVRFEMEMTR